MDKSAQEYPAGWEGRMNQRPTISIEISMSYINWMMANPELLNETEKEWIAEFTRLFKEHINDIPNQPQTPQDNP